VTNIAEDEDSLVILQFLETLPNLQVLEVDPPLLPAYLSQFISSIQHTALLELVLDITRKPVEGLPTAGLSGLERLCITWRAYDNPNEPGSSLAHLYELIRPSLTTLVVLTVDNMPESDGLSVSDLHLLKPTANTLRTFECTLQSADESILDTIPAILPHLTGLSIIWDDYLKKHSVLWKDEHIQALSKNNNLIDLELSSNFEVNAQDTSAIAEDDYAWLVRCYKRRLKATQDIALACPRLEQCIWVQMGADFNESSEIDHSFFVEERMTGGNMTRVVRGIEQGWMGRNYDTRYRGGGIVKCKLKHLPGDIIGQEDGVEFYLHVRA